MLFHERSNHSFLEHLQYAVNSLQWKFDKAQKLCEERSQQARDAESMVIELKTSMQRLHQC